MVAEPTRADVARRAGVSTAVVSYVVNDGPRPVAAATRRRVEAAIAELGYRPNGLARALRSRESGLVGLVVPDVAISFFAELQRAVEAAVAAQGRLLVLGSSRYDDALQDRYVTAFAELRVEGIIAVTSTESAASNRTFTALDVPVVFLNRRPRRLAGVSSVSVDNEGGSRALTARLVAAGHRRIACLAGGAAVEPVAERARGWTAAMAAAGLRTEGLLLASAFDRRAAREAARRWLDEHRDVTAVVCGTDEQAFGVLLAAHDLGLAVPEQLAVAGFNGVAEAADALPPLTTVAQPIERMGHEAVGLLLGGGRRATHRVVPTELVVRASTGPLPG